MIVADFECRRCHRVHEAITSHGKAPKCPVCGANTKRIITAGRVNMVNEAPEWLKSVVDVADRSSDKAHVKAFVKNPTRRTYREWMKGEGIRPMDYTEHGAPPMHKPPPEPDVKRLREAVARRHFERKRIEVG